ncbi:MAG: hypothetical protein WBG49_18700 [Thermoanaerobaculia bacterium]
MDKKSGDSSSSELLERLVWAEIDSELTAEERELLSALVADAPESTALQREIRAMAEALDGVERVEPPRELLEGVRRALSERARHPGRQPLRFPRAIDNATRWEGGTMSRNSKLALIAAVLALAVGLIVFLGPDRVADDDAAGAIGAADRYREEQMTDEDVQLDNAEAQSWLQTETYDQVMTNPELLAIVTDEGLQAALGNDALRDALGNDALRDALGSDAFRDALGSDAFLDALGSDAFRDALGSDAFRDALGSDAFRDALGSDAFRDALGSDAFRDALGSDAFRDALGSDAFRDALGSDAFRDALGSDAFRDALGSDAFRDALGSDAFRDALGSDAFLDALGSDAMRDSVRQEQ